MQYTSASSELSTVDSRSENERKPPLVVDLDGTLTPTDTLYESLILLFKHNRFALRRLPMALIKGKAAFKAEIAANTNLDPAHLPWRNDLIEYLKAEKRDGRQIVLATAAHQSIATKVAEHWGIFDKVLSTDSGHNLKGVAKLDAIIHEVGNKFTYAGDHKADLPIWHASESAILVDTDSNTTAEVKRSTSVEREFRYESATPLVWLKALRLHQWVKNLLLFVPLLTAFSFQDPTKLIKLCIAFFAFGIAASGTYILNDLWDLSSDRKHPRKRNRPFASGALPVHHGLVIAACALVLSVAISTLVSTAFMLMLLLYIAATTAYSWVFKTYVLMDVVTLSLLYSLRILAGSVAVGIPTSSWLLAFSVFFFLSLALVKRCAELVSMQELGSNYTRGRDYRVSDLVVLWPMGVGAALCAVVVFGLFINAPETRARYASPELLWLIAIGLIYWLARLWIKTSRGEMHDDPIVYAIKDRGSRVVVLGLIAVMILAKAVSIRTLL